MIVFNLNETNFTINENPISFPIPFETLQQILGDLCRKKVTKSNTIYTWDDLGILAYSKDGKLVETLSIDLILEKYKFSPKKNFQGKFYFNETEIVPYYKAHKDKRVPLFKGDTSKALVLNTISVWFDVCDKEIEALEISAYNGPEKSTIPTDKYIIKPLEEAEITFQDFGFKLSIIQELMYNKNLITPAFDLFEFVDWYTKRDIDLEEEGYEPIKEVTQYFRDLPIPKRLAPEITKIYQDGGNNIYLNLLRFAEGWEDYWDIETTVDTIHFPNLKTAVLCYAKDHVLTELNEKGIQAEWI